MGSADGAGEVIAILDSISAPPSAFSARNIVDSGSFVSGDEEQKSPHGFFVYQILSKFAPNASWCFYQINSTNDQRKPFSAFQKAIDRCISRNVDIVNLSAGKLSDSECQGNCPYCIAVGDLIDEGIHVVCSAGNRDRDNDGNQEVKCPAKASGVIAVGGLSTECPEDINRGGVYPEPSNILGPYWVEEQPHAEYHNSWDPEINHCCNDVCSDGEQCFKKNREGEWVGNVERWQDKPEIYAPVHYPISTLQDVPELIAGTSFAAPIVTGVIGSILSDTERDPIAIDQLRDAIIETGDSLPCGELTRLNGFDLYKHFKS